MSDTQSNDPRPAPEPHPSTSAGPAGWPGATHFGKGVDEPVPQPARVEEVEAIPLSKSQARGPAIEVEAERVASEPRGGAQHAPNAGSTFGSQTGTGQPPPTTPPPFGTPPPPPNSGASAVPHSGTRIWAVFSHLAYLIPVVIPGLILTTFIWVVTRRDDAFTDDQAREAINFQLFYGIITLLLAASCIGWWLIFPVWLIGAVLSVVAAVNAGDGKKYRYPYIFRLIA